MIELTEKFLLAIK